MAQEAKNSRVQVEVFGQAFTLSGNIPDDIPKIAEYVDSQVRDVADGSPLRPIAFAWPCSWQ